MLSQVSHRGLMPLMDMSTMCRIVPWITLNLWRTPALLLFCSGQIGWFAGKALALMSLSRASRCFLKQLASNISWNTWNLALKIGLYKLAHAQPTDECCSCPVFMLFHAKQAQLRAASEINDRKRKFLEKNFGCKQSLVRTLNALPSNT